MIVHAKDVKIARVFQAQCQITGCGWKGDPKTSYEAANTERTAHLDDDHRLHGTGRRA